MRFRSLKAHPSQVIGKWLLRLDDLGVTQLSLPYLVEAPPFYTGYRLQRPESESFPVAYDETFERISRGAVISPSADVSEQDSGRVIFFDPDLNSVPAGKTVFTLQPSVATYDGDDSPFSVYFDPRKPRFSGPWNWFFQDSPVDPLIPERFTSSPVFSGAASGAGVVDVSGWSAAKWRDQRGTYSLGDWTLEIF